MKLFEVTNGFIGESYVRLYVVIETAEEAIDIARAAYLRHEHNADTLNVRECVDFQTVIYGFCTRPSDSGWEIEEPSS